MSESLRILMVEDNPADAFLIREMLPETGPQSFHIETAVRLVEVILRLPDKGIDLVLLDLGLPDSQGLQTLHQLHQAAPDVPVIVLTGTDDQELGVAAVQEGAQDYLVKGQVSTHMLVRSIRYALERHKAGISIRESEEFKQSIFDSVTSHLAVLDQSGTVTAVNARWQEFARANPISASETAKKVGIGANYLEVCRHSHGACLEEAMAAHDGILAVLTGGRETFALEYRCDSPDEQRWFSMVVSPLGKAGRAVLVSHTNVTEIKRMEESLRRSEEQFRAMFELASIGIAQADPCTGKFQRVNQKLCALTGYTPEELLGMRIPDITNSADRQKDMDAFQQVIRGEAPDCRMEKRYIHKDGTAVWVNVNMTVLRDADGQPVHTLASIEDITERKAAERKLQESATRLGVIFNQSPLGIVMSRLDNGRIVEVNAAFADLFGYTCDETIGHSSAELKMWPIPAERDTMIQRLRTQGRCTDYEIKARKKSGEICDLMVLAELIELSGEQFTLELAQDITGRKQLQAQFLQAQKMESVGQLAGGVAHDFNNILAAILLQLGFLRQKSNLDPELQESLKEMKVEAQRAANMTRQLLLFSRRSEMEAKVIDLNELAANLLKMLGRLIGEHISLRFEPFEPLPPVEADPGMVEQILMNLAVNARDAMPKGGSLTISIKPMQIDAQRVKGMLEAIPGFFVCLSVTDNGCGMDEATRKRIFEPFFTTKEPGKGTGLGLATVHGIAAQHKGWVEVESELGQGSTFKVFLPAISMGLPGARQIAEEMLVRGDETILLVEDEEGVRRGVRQVLRLLGYRVLEAANGEAALKLWQEHGGHVDLLFSDMLMPGRFTGLDLAEKLREQQPGLKVIISSGYNTDKAEQDRSTSEGIAFLQKPYEPESLSSAIRECLDKK